MLNKELIDRAWACLPREFREEVKELYRHENKVLAPIDGVTTLNEIFGLHNLTSDTEGEEMLTVPRKRVMEIYNHCNGGGAQVIEDIFGKLTYDMNNDAIITPLDKFKGLPHLNEKQEVITDYEGYAPTLYPYEGQWFVSWVSSEGDSILDFKAESPEKAIELAYNHLFGSKCLPDGGTDCTPVEVGVAENATTSNVDSLEPKPAEPRFKEGDIVRYRYDGKLYIVECKTGKYHYALRQPDGDVMIHDVLESDLEPYPKQEVKRHVSVKEVCDILGVDESEATKLVKSEPIETCTDTCTDNCSSPDHFVVKDEMVDNIIKAGFKNHNRLHIAAILAAGMLASEVRCYPVDRALELADKLIAECEKGVNNA